LEGAVRIFHRLTTQHVRNLIAEELESTLLPAEKERPRPPMFVAATQDLIDTLGRDRPD
jgi:hypothetical protein